MLCGTSSTCTLKECPRWQNSYDNDINPYLLDGFPHKLESLKNSYPQYSYNSHTSDDCSDNNGNKDCHQAYENIRRVIDFIDNQIYPLIRNFDYSDTLLSSFVRHKSYIILQNTDVGSLEVETQWGMADCYKNAYALYNQEIIFGQYNDNGGQRHSIADQLEVVAHEFCHVLIKQICPHRFASDIESKALEESFCDFFAILASRYVQGTWNWIIGQNIDNGVRDFLNPSIAHMDQYMITAMPDETNDWGYVHTNCGIHSKACAKIITSIDDFDFLCKLFCLTLLKLIEDRKLDPTASVRFVNSREAMKGVVEGKAMSDLSEEERHTILFAIVDAFDSVGIQESQDPPSREPTVE